MNRIVGNLMLLALWGVVMNGSHALAAGGEVPLLSETVKIKFNEALDYTLDLKAAPASPVYLKFSGRIETERWQSGSAAACRVLVNDMPTSLERLRNKPPYYFFTAENRVKWYDDTHAAWVFSYYPWDDLSRAGGQANHFVLDITDLLKPGENRITFRSMYRYGNLETFLTFRHARVLFHDDFVRAPLKDKTPVATESHGLDRFRMRARAWHAGVTVRLNTEEDWRPDVGTVVPKVDYAQSYSCGFDAATRRLKVAVNGETWEAFSSARVGDAPWFDVGYTDKKGQAATDWPTFRMLPDSAGFDAQNDRARWERRIVKRPSHIEIRDTFTNRTQSDLPVVILNGVDGGSPSELAEFRIGGIKQKQFYACTSSMQSRMTAMTPVAYAARRASGLAMTLVDDAYRNHAAFLAWDAAFAAGDDLFYLCAGESHTFVWRLYPVADRNYFTFINTYRHNRNLYQRIPGLFGFVQPGTKERMYECVRYKTAEEIGGFMKSVGIEIASAGAVYREEGKPANRRMLYGGEKEEVFRKGLSVFDAWRKKAHQGGAAFKSLPYMNLFICRLVDGETLDQMQARLPDTLARDPWGTPVAYRAGWLYCIVPTLENAAGKHLFRLMDMFLDEFKYEGIYIDEWIHSRARVSFAHVDGMSALLDEHGRIMRKVAFMPIISKAFQIAYINKLTERGATVFVNQFAGTAETDALPMVHFAEPVRYDDYLLYAAQHSRSPLSLHLKPRVNLFENVREFLKRGVLTCYYWYYLHGDHVLKRCYPITVRRIEPGVVVGDDRIITCSSGDFSLGRSKPLTAYVYAGPEGLLHETRSSMTVNAKGQTVMRLEVSDNQIAVIMEE